jgi:class 3 adenylate cyclase
MPDLTPRQRARLPDSAFAYVDSTGRRLLPIHDEAHVRNALARFGRVSFEDEAARDRARARLLRAAKRYGIVPLGFLAGQLEPHRRLPTGQVTLLLTDVEGSTPLLVQLGDAYTPLIARLRRILRREVRRAGGHEVDARADEFLAAFADTPAALTAALAAQQAIAAEPWPRGDPLRVRMGIHTGRPTLTSAGYVGLAVNVTARICAAAHGGQVLLSLTAAGGLGGPEPVLDRGASGLRYLGEFRLRGVAQPIGLLQADVEGQPAEFPPPREVERVGPC